MLRYRIKRFTDKSSERMGKLLERHEHSGQLTDCRWAVNRVPESQKTPIRIDVKAGTGDDSEARIVETEVYLSLDDAQRLVELLSATLKHYA